MVPSVNELINKYKCRFTDKPNLLALTPEVLDLIPMNQVLVDFYGNKKTKEEFLKERKGVLYHSKNGGPTIFCLEVSKQG